MDKVSKQNFAAYLHDARSWETGANLALQKSARIAWRAAAAGAVIGVLGIAAAALQATQEPPLPVVLRVDNSTGIVDRVTSLTEGKITSTEATDKYFAQLYVLRRERWDQKLAKEDFYDTALMSTPAEQQRYLAYYRGPQSPMKVYGDAIRVRPEIIGTSFIQPGVASVRYIRTVERPNGNEVSHHTATITFAYSSGRMSERDRAINPFGFQAEYRTDPDAPGVEPVVVAPAPAVATAPTALAVGGPERPPLDLQPLQPGGK